MHKFLAQNFGTVAPPPEIANRFGSIESGGLGIFINTILRLLVVVAGVYTVFNIVLAGYAFLSAGDDPKKIGGAWSKIWQSILGFVVAAGALVIAAIVGWVFFGDPYFLVSPKIPTP